MGLHEVYALCESEDHQIEACPYLPVQSKVEIIVEKFGGGCNKVVVRVNHPFSSASEPVTTTDKWIRVSSKKRFRYMAPSAVGKPSLLKAPLLPKVTIVESVMTLEHPDSPSPSSHAKHPGSLSPSSHATPDKDIFSPLVPPAIIDENIVLAHPNHCINHEVPEE